MKKEEWINSILESASGIEDAEPSPFLFGKIMNKLEQQEPATANPVRYRLAFSAAVLLLLLINISALVIYKSQANNQDETVAISALSKEMNPTTTYNY